MPTLTASRPSAFKICRTDGLRSRRHSVWNSQEPSAERYRTSVTNAMSSSSGSIVNLFVQHTEWPAADTGTGKWG